MLVARPNDRQERNARRGGVRSTARWLRLIVLCGLIPAASVNAARATATTTATPFTVSVTVHDFCRVEAADVRFDATNSGAVERNVGVRNPIALTCNRGVTVSSVAISNDALEAMAPPRRINAGAWSGDTAQIPSRVNLEGCSPLRAERDAGSNRRVGAVPLLGRKDADNTMRLCTFVVMPQGNSVALAYAGMVRVSFTYN